MECAKGGAFYFEGSTIYIENAEFKNITCNGEGGVLYLGLEPDSKYEFIDCTFEDITSIEASLVYDKSPCNSDIDRIITRASFVGIII